ncbi:acyl-CoA thioesterase [Streptomyces sp. 8N616]|uniref:acyl-CoA thioesterase n=1 Tax=Streptomyces sp. 8N616 TaxID=3457414 RepID=UPI003FD610AF
MTTTAVTSGETRPGDGEPPAVVRVDRSWGSGPGAHGGYLAALGLGAMRARLALDSGHDRPVRSLTTHFLARVDDRPLALHTTVERSGRGTAVAGLRAEQGGEQALLGSATFGSPRPGPYHHGSPAPAVPGPGDCPPLALPQGLATFAQRLEIRPATPARPLGGGESAELVAWMRFRDGRPLDAGAVTVLADAPPPALFALWTAPRPVPTAELTVHYGSALDDGPATGWALVRIRGEHAGSGWAVDDSAVWDADGHLLALARQARRVLGAPS